MLNQNDIKENMEFIRKVIELTTKNMEWTKCLKPKVFKDLFLLENLAIGWDEHIIDIMPIHKQNELYVDILKIYLKYYTQKNKLRMSAYEIRPDKIKEYEDNVDRIYKGK